MSKPHPHEKYTSQELSHLYQDNPAQIEEEIVEWLAYQNSRPQSIHAVIVEGSKTKNGGIAKATYPRSDGGVVLDGNKEIIVGDTVEYEDGTIATVISGTGKAASFEGRGIAITGSHLDNGDVFEESLQKAVLFREFLDQEPTEGFLVPYWASAKLS